MTADTLFRPRKPFARMSSASSRSRLRSYRPSDPGYVFELARADDEAVDIVANGRRIGRGRIVDVSGALGIQVVRIGP